MVKSEITFTFDSRQFYLRPITINHDLFTKNSKLATLKSEGGVGASGHRFTVWWKKEKKNFEWKIGSQVS